MEESSAVREFIESIPIKELENCLKIENFNSGNTSLVDKAYNNKMTGNARGIRLIKEILDGRMFSTVCHKEINKRCGEHVFSCDTGKRVFRGITGFQGNAFFVSLKKDVDQTQELANALGISRSILDKYEEEKKYNKFFIWKDDAKTKKRWIEAPEEDLKMIQKKILYKILYGIRPSRYAHGFMRGRSIVTCAKEHTGKKFVLKIDLKDFFPTITKEMVENAIYDVINPENFRYIFKAIEFCCKDGVLPQGAPTSPALSNIVMRNVDHLISEICNRVGNISYTRYADDLIFSSDNDILNKMYIVFKAILNDAGFRVNKEKVKILKHYQRQTVTGLVVNKEGQVSVRRRKRMNLRAYMHGIVTGRIPIEHVNMEKLSGNIAIIKMANPVQGEKFTHEFEKIKEMKYGH